MPCVRLRRLGTNLAELHSCNLCLTKRDLYFEAVEDFDLIIMDFGECINVCKCKLKYMGMRYSLCCLFAASCTSRLFEYLCSANAFGGALLNSGKSI